jgi:hypothetical protein
MESCNGTSLVSPEEQRLATVGLTVTISDDELRLLDVQNVPASGRLDDSIQEPLVPSHTFLLQSPPA